MRNWLAPLRVARSAFITWRDDALNLLILNLACIVCTVTVLLAPPALFAIYDATQQLVRGAAPNLKELYLGLRRYFFISWLWLLANVLCLLVLAANVMFYSRIDATWALYVRTIFLGLVLFWLAMQFYAIPYLMFQDTKSLRIAWRNAFLTILASPGYTLVLLFISLLLLVLGVTTAIPFVLGMLTYIPILGNQAVQDRLEAFGVQRDDP